MTKRDEAPVGAPCWIDLLTSDADRARHFYGELLGWTADEGAEEYGGYFTFFKDGLRIAGGMPNDGSQGQPDAWTVYLASADAQATTDAAAAHGGRVDLPPMPIPPDLGSMAVLADPGQATIGVWQPGSHKGFQVYAEPGTPSWFELHTREYEASVAFYRDVFSWDTHVASDVPDFRYTTLGEGDAALAGIMDASAMLPEGAPAAWSIYFQVEDADKALARVVELGGSVVRPPEPTPYGRLAEAADTTGVHFKLVQP
jgi:uncharacterized protein